MLDDNNHVIKDGGVHKIRDGHHTQTDSPDNNDHMIKDGGL